MISRLLPSPPRPSLPAALTSIAGLLLAGLLLAAAAPRPAAAPGPGGANEVLTIRVHSIIQPAAAEFITGAIARADGEGARALVIELDTPGGLMTSMRDIFTAMLAARTPVVVYVAPSGAEAASAGFFLLMAADVAAMAPGTNAGAAHPVGGQGETIEGTMGKKVEEDAAATIRSLARRNGRNEPLAEAAVLQSRSFTADEALKAKLIDLVAPSLPKLLAALDGRTIQRGEAPVVLHTAGVPVRELEMSPLGKLLSTIAHPNIAYILLTLGGLGLFFELSHPGAVLPGVVGAVCLILAFYALSVLPVDYAGMALLLLALIFFVAELKVASHGMLTLAGILSLILGSVMLFKSPEPALRVSTSVIASLAAFAGLVVGFLTWRVVKARRAPVRTGLEGMLHEHGRAQTPLAPRGKVFVHGEIWDAVLDPPGEPVAGGETVEIVAVEDFTLRVRPLRPARSA
ncbi:MAG TPA: nodulation protein NfeD [Thermoanaerobaculia bacterium]|nr:nodulation protein NfeD [Thermoanaerobaculia bacterium]